jgi:hypothetical protein
VRDDFRVRFRFELVPLSLELFLQLQVVLDDAVVNDDDPPGAVAFPADRLRAIPSGLTTATPAES